VLPTMFAQAIALSLIDYSRNHLGQTGTDAYHIAIGFSGGSFILGSLVLLWTKRYVQGNWKILCKA
jgi:hypothetical protein